MAVDPIEKHGVRPVTWWLDNLLSGRFGMDEIPQSVRSWADFFFWQAAREMVLMTSADDRREALGKVPERVRPYVEAELARLWPMRREIRAQ